jgi:hypothetical protein
MRSLRFLIAIPAIAGLALMGATGASAAPVRQAAVHAPTATGTPRTTDPYEFENPNGLWIVGGTHNAGLTGSTSGGSAYVQYDSPATGYYVYSLNDLCWETSGASGADITMESCPSDDANEWFATPLENGDYGYLESGVGSGLCIWGAGNGKTVFLKACSPTNDRDIWPKISV